MFICFHPFLAEVASRQGFFMSQWTSGPKGYTVVNKNPILECLPIQKPDNLSSSLVLRDEIIHALTKEIIEWPQQYNNLIKKDQWISLMKKNPSFYKNQSRTAQEMFYHEGILLNLASRYLKKKITLIPFLDGDEEATFVPSQDEAEFRNSETIYLLCCNKVYHDNFFINVLPKV